MLLKRIVIDLSALTSAPDERTFIKEFLEACAKIIFIVERGLDTVQNGAYTIADMICDDRVLLDRQLLKICLLASDLEEIADASLPSTREKWQQLKIAVATLRSEKGL